MQCWFRVSFLFEYILTYLQVVLRTESQVPNNTNEDGGLDESEPLVMVDSKEAPISVHVDKTPSSTHSGFKYDYGSKVVLGGSSHRGLGFSDEPEEIASGAEASSKEVEEEDKLCSDSTVQEMNNEAEADADMDEKVLAGKSYPRMNSAFLPIGGVRLYTQDISGQESGEDEYSESEDEEISESSEPDGIEDAEDTSDSDSDIDEEVAKDYIEGIGGRDNVSSVKLFEEQEFDESTDDTSSSSEYEKTVKKLGGIALQEASTVCSIMKTYPNQRHVGRGRFSTMDDLMFVKDPRTAFGRKKHIPQLPQSWPCESQRNKTSKKFPGMNLIRDLCLSDFA